MQTILLPATFRLWLGKLPRRRPRISSWRPRAVAEAGGVPLLRPATPPLSGEGPRKGERAMNHQHLLASAGARHLIPYSLNVFCTLPEMLSLIISLVSPSPSMFPESVEYVLEVLRGGSLVSGVPVSARDHYTFGRCGWFSVDRAHCTWSEYLFWSCYGLSTLHFIVLILLFFLLNHRSPDCDFVLEHPSSSRLHAVLQFNGETKVGSGASTVRYGASSSGSGKPDGNGWKSCPPFLPCTRLSSFSPTPSQAAFF